jgi:hypothetical protein
VAKKASRRLVIDASVARSATSSDNPTSNASREFLQAILDVCHKIVLTPELHKEWDFNALQIRSPADRKRTRFLTDWMLAMARRKGGKILRPRIPRDEALRNKINHLGLPEQSRQEISEDLHLIEAALASDSVVVSRDDSVRALLQSITSSCPEFSKVVWCNPVELGKDGLEWLHEGARSVKAWQLGSKRSS